jgi:hypothetical protein
VAIFPNVFAKVTVVAVTAEIVYEPVKHPGKDADDPVVVIVIGSPTENP